MASGRSASSGRLSRAATCPSIAKPSTSPVWHRIHKLTDCRLSKKRKVAAAPHPKFSARISRFFVHASVGSVLQATVSWHARSYTPWDNSDELAGRARCAMARIIAGRIVPVDQNDLDVVLTGRC
jgi:hypothetical protein